MNIPNAYDYASARRQGGTGRSWTSPERRERVVRRREKSSRPSGGNGFVERHGWLLLTAGIVLVLFWLM